MTMPRGGFIAMLLLLLAAAGAAGDTVTLRGTTIPLPGCEIQDIRHGRLYFSDSRGRRQWRDLDEVAALGFEELPNLDEAERLLAAGQSDAALARFLQSMLEADGELETLWLRVRLARVHDARGEYVQAAGHTAAVFMLRDEPSWRRLEPVSRPDRPSYPAAREAVLLLQQADRTVSDPQLAAVVDRLLEAVRPIAAELEAGWDGPPIERGSTISGYPIERIRGEAFDLAAEPNAAGAGETDAAPPGEIADHSSPGAASGDSAEAIDALLDAGRAADARIVCQRVAQRPGNRSLGRFLHQYGRALAGVGRRRDAAVMFMRGALLYDASASAAPSLVEAALIHRDVFRNRPAARRLAERAREIAAAQGDSTTVRRARDILSGLDDD
ncbi:MAG: hypothetical protein SYC29_08705 [Planctomycetota bacterium]|nr:hypothetical protein [Planctomycetota bacterium]